MTYFSKTLTLVITSEPSETGLSYFTCVFLVTRPFIPHHYFWPSDLDLELWITYTKCCYLNLVAVRRTLLSSDNSCFHVAPRYFCLWLQSNAKSFCDNLFFWHPLGLSRCLDNRRKVWKWAWPFCFYNPFKNGCNFLADQIGWYTCSTWNYCNKLWIFIINFLFW